MKTQILGRSGEATAMEYMRKKRYEILDASFHSRYGEIDFIAKKGNVVVFAEVKLRANNNWANAFESVTQSKQDKIKKTALVWMAKYDKDYEYRFDVIEVYTEKKSINHIENAFN